MSDSSSRRHASYRTLLALTFTLAPLGCLTEPDVVSSLHVTPTTLSFSSPRAEPQNLTVTVIGTDGKTRNDVAVTWSYWSSDQMGLGEWITGVPSFLARFERVNAAANTWLVGPGIRPGFVSFRAHVADKTVEISATTEPGPPVALVFERAPPQTAQRDVPFQVSIGIVDADRFRTNSVAPVTASISFGQGTLSGTTTVNASGTSADFQNLAIRGTGLFMLRFSSPGLTDIVSGLISVTAAP